MSLIAVRDRCALVRNRCALTNCPPPLKKGGDFKKNYKWFKCFQTILVIVSHHKSQIFAPSFSLKMIPTIRSYSDFFSCGHIDGVTFQLNFFKLCSMSRPPNFRGGGISSPLLGLLPKMWGAGSNSITTKATNVPLAAHKSFNTYAHMVSLSFIFARAKMFSVHCKFHFHHIDHSFVS